uniref:Protein Dr1 n=1 Tax=Pygocentrus nattereri TaxID=42514 RepID=A0AAR2L0S3_PYGNA
MASSSGNDDDLTIPRAAINKMIKETLPNVRVANDARELVVNCCTEFIHLISSEANEICNKSEKKTISPEHVINALESLGFGSYIAEVKDVLQECKTVALKRRKASSRLENLGIPEEELLRQQQELFAKQAALRRQNITVFIYCNSTPTRSEQSRHTRGLLCLRVGAVVVPVWFWVRL